MIIVTSSFRKASFLKCFPSARKRKVGVFNFLSFEERLRKASRRISVDGRHNLRNEAAFSKFSSVMWTRPNLVSCLFFFFSAESYYPKFRESGIIQTLIKMIKTEAINPQTCYNAMAVLESFSLKGLEGFSRCKARLPNALDKQSRSQSPLVFCF